MLVSASCFRDELLLDLLTGQRQNKKQLIATCFVFFLDFRSLITLCVALVLCGTLGGRVIPLLPGYSIHTT